MLTTVPQADIQRAGVSTISVGSVGIGPISIGQLVLTDLSLTTAHTGAELRNFRVNISHHMTLDWHLHIEIPGHLIDEGGTEDLGTPTFACNFGNLNIPGLESIKLDVASLTADNIAATANAISNLQLGAAVAEQIQARNLKLPTAGFTIAGLGIGALRVGGFGAPAASLDSATIGRVQGAAFPVGDVVLSNLALPSASVADVVSQGIDAVATPFGKAYHLDLGCLDLTLKIKPRAEAHIDQLTIHGITASTSIGQITLHNVVAPFELLNLTLAQVGIETISVPNVVIA
jgi:hypothetical protein